MKVPGNPCASSIVLGAAKAVREANNKVLILKLLILFLWKALKWPISFKRQQAVWTNKWSANKRRFHLYSEGYSVYHSSKAP